jgi:tetratricopeptide (TPR) repeat protein
VFKQKKKKAPVPTEAKSDATESSSKTPSISLCMIVRDEEDWIAQCIDSVKSIVSEIIVVDTGSVDKTVEIAESRGAKVFFQAWENDFAKARNFSIEKASGDWILVLDADEAIAEKDLLALTALIQDDKICWEFLQRHYSNDHRLSEYKPVSGEYPEWEKGFAGYFESNCVRLFPHKQGLSYEGRVHELVEHSIRKVGKHEIHRTQVRIQHFGHTEKVKAKKDKSSIYTPLGMEKLKDDPTYWQAYFELAVEHNQNGRHQQSVIAFLQSLAMMPNYVPAWVNLGYVLCEMGNYRLSEHALLSALEYDQKSDEAFCNLGVVYMRTNQLRKAEQVLKRAWELNPSYVNAAINLGKTLAMQNRASEAVLVYRRILQMMPKCAVAKADLGSVYLSQRMFREAEICLRGALEDDPNISRVYLQLGQLLRAVNRVDESVMALTRFVAMERGRPGKSAQEEQFIARIEASL